MQEFTILTIVFGFALLRLALPAVLLILVGSLMRHGNGNGSNNHPKIQPDGMGPA